jgi:hypothetical protein
MCNLYSLNKSQAAIMAMARAMGAGEGARPLPDGAPVEVSRGVKKDGEGA